MYTYLTTRNNQQDICDKALIWAYKDFTNRPKIMSLEDMENQTTLNKLWKDRRADIFMKET